MARLVRAELRKVFSTKLWWGLLIPVAVLSLLVNLFSGLITTGLATDPVATGGVAVPLLLASLAYALSLTSVFAALFGLVTSAGEFRHRTVTTTYLTAPGRGPVLLAKMAAAAGVGALYAVVAVAVGIVGGLLGGVGAAFPPVGTLLAGVGVGLVVVAMWAALGAALGTVISNQVTVLVVTLVYLLIGEVLISLLLNRSGSPTVARFTPYLPGNAGDIALYDIPLRAIVGPRDASQAVELLAGVTAPPPWWGALLILAAWTAATAATGWVVGGRRDVT